MKPLKGTETEKNLLTAFSGESQARNRYTIFAAKAKEDGFVFVRDIFLETADQEAQHAKRLWNFLEGGLVEISGKFPAGVVSDTAINLQEAAAGEHEEYADMYPTMAQTADKEGFTEIARVMRCIAVAEKYHEKRYLDLRQRILDGTMFKNPTKTTWRCLNCGYTVEATNPPAECPACAHPIAFFIRENVTFA